MPEKLVIRVVNAPSPDQQDETKPKVIVEYHWTRIIAASILLIALLTGFIWGGLHLFNQSADNLPAVYERMAVPVEKANPPQADNPITAASSAKVSPQASSNNSPSTSSKPTASNSTPSAVQSSPPSAPIQQLVGNAVVSTQPAQTATESNVAILSGNIKMAQLTSGVHDSQPVDKLGQTIPMNEKGLIRVYLFMETEGVKGNVLFHDWLWKGKRIAHARIPIKRKTHAAASSKFIDRIMLGPWEVKIVDERNRVLAKTAFEVK